MSNEVAFHDEEELFSDEEALSAEVIDFRADLCRKYADEIRGKDEAERNKIILHLRMMKEGGRAPEGKKCRFMPAMAAGVLEELDIDSTSPLTPAEAEKERAEIEAALKGGDEPYNLPDYCFVSIEDAARDENDADALRNFQETHGSFKR